MRLILMLAMAVLAPLAASPADARDGTSIRNVPAIVGVWEGTYSCGQGATGLHLEIMEGTSGSLTAVFSFYPLVSNPGVPVGSFVMHGTYSGSRVSLKGDHWLRHPAGYEVADLVASMPRAGSRQFTGSIVGCSKFSVERVTGQPAASNIAGTWVGSYLGCRQGATALRLVVAAHSGNRLTATFSFSALRSNPSVPAGSYSMTGFYFPGGVILEQVRWINRPHGYVMRNLVGTPPPAGGRHFAGVIVSCSTFSLTRA